VNPASAALLGQAEAYWSNEPREFAFLEVNQNNGLEFQFQTVLDDASVSGFWLRAALNQSVCFQPMDTWIRTGLSGANARDP